MAAGCGKPPVDKLIPNQMFLVIDIWISVTSILQCATILLVPADKGKDDNGIALQYE